MAARGLSSSPSGQAGDDDRVQGGFLEAHGTW